MGVKRRSYHKVNNKDFETIKALLNAGLGASKIHDITGRSFGVIGLVRKSESLEGYQEEVRKITEKHAKKEIEV